MAILTLKNFQTKYNGKNLKFIGYSIDADRGHLKSLPLSLKIWGSNGQSYWWYWSRSCSSEENISPWTMPSTVYWEFRNSNDDHSRSRRQVLKTIRARPEENWGALSEEKETPAGNARTYREQSSIGPPMFQFAATTILETMDRSTSQQANS